jgi:hypothetical protein
MLCRAHRSVATGRTYPAVTFVELESSESEPVFHRWRSIDQFYCHAAPAATRCSNARLVSGAASSTIGSLHGGSTNSDTAKMGAALLEEVGVALPGRDRWVGPDPVHDRRLGTKSPVFRTNRPQTAVMNTGNRPTPRLGPRPEHTVASPVTTRLRVVVLREREPPPTRIVTESSSTATRRYRRSSCPT